MIGPVQSASETDQNRDRRIPALQEWNIKNDYPVALGTDLRDLVDCLDSVDPMRREDWAEWDGLTFGQLHWAYVRERAELVRLRGKLAAVEALLALNTGPAFERIGGGWLAVPAIRAALATGDTA